MAYTYLKSLITMGQGNVVALKETMESFKHVVSEFVYGDMLLFEEDRKVLHEYKKQYNLKIVPLSFDFIFKFGFSNTLNLLADKASYRHVLYMNTGEAIDEDYGIDRMIFDNPDCNIFYFTHRTDPHRWYRVYDKTELKWSGRIHEQLAGEYRPFHKPIYMMKDLPKDMDDPFKAKVFDTFKEAVYFKNYMDIIDDPASLGETDPGWIKFATDNYESFKERLLKKGAGYDAIKTGDYEGFMRYVHNDADFQKEVYESSIAIEFQNNKIFLL